MKTTKKLIAIVLSVILLVSVCPLGLFTFTASAETVSGSCGKNVTWRYDTPTATLTVSGTGAMNNYSSSWYNGPDVTTAPWQSYYETMKSVVINSGVTSIGERAFFGCAGLTSVTIPDSVTSIGNYAFYGCTGLTSVTIPDSVTSIGYGAFFGCAGLASVTIGDSVTSIGDRAFYGCTGLKSITIPDSVTEIGGDAFYGCVGLSSITIPDSVTSIGSSAFYNTAWYNNQPDGLVYAGKMAYNYKGTCPASVTIKDGTLGIADSAFRECLGLMSVTIPNSVTSIGYQAFCNCTGLTSITIPDSVTEIGDRAFENTAWYNNQPNGLVYAGKVAYKYKGTCPASVTIKDGTLGIAYYAFYNCTGLTSITIPDSVTSIGYQAFCNCTELTSITIPDSVTEIGDYAFYKCTGLTSITIPDSVTEIDSYVFYNCTGLTSVTIGNSVTSIGESAFYGCAGLTSITIPNSVTSIGYEAFAYCTGLTSITIPNSVTSIGERVYYWCTGLKTITIPDSVTSIGDYAFYYCNRLKTVYYRGNQAQWGNMSIGYYNSPLISANLIFHPEHDFYMVLHEPTRTNRGYTEHICSVCGYNYKGEYTFPQLSDGEDNGFLIEDDTLFIYGTGDIANYKTQASVPWYEYANQITEIQIDESITKIGNYAFYCLENVKSIKSKNNNLAFGKYAINGANSNITVLAENGGNVETYCAENGINYIDPTITPEVETVTANSITVKAVEGYKYSKDGTTWQKSNKFTGLSPAREYNIYARYAAAADIFDTVGAPLIVTTLKSTVAAPAAPDYQSHTENSITLVPNNLYEYSLDGENWQKSSEFTGLSKNTIYRFYQRVAETETEYASAQSKPLIVAIPDKPQIARTTTEKITVKQVAGFEYCLDDMVWQDSNIFDKLIDNEEYTVYQRLKAVDGEKVYQIVSEPTIALTVVSGNIPGDISGDGSLNNKDLTRLFQYLSDWDVEVDEAALDVNGDGAVNNKDLTRLFQYLSDWDVEIF